MTAITTQAHFYYQKEMTDADVQPFLKGQAAVFSLTSPDKDTENEDAAALIPVSATSGILVVADGLGVHRGGAEASKRAISSLDSSLKKAIKNEKTLREGIMSGFESANQSVKDQGVGAGTTLAVVEVDKNQVRPYHVGDSQILIVGQRGKVKFQSVPHSPVGYAVESGLISEDEALKHDERHVVSNTIGSDDMSVEVGVAFELDPLDTVVIASDGLFDNLSLEEIVDITRAGQLDETATALKTLCHKRMTAPKEGHPSKPDDLTFVLYRLNGK